MEGGSKRKILSFACRSFRKLTMTSTADHRLFIVVNCEIKMRRIRVLSWLWAIEDLESSKPVKHAGKLSNRPNNTHVLKTGNGDISDVYKKLIHRFDSFGNISMGNGGFS